jgi:hypothetical protein
MDPSSRLGRSGLDKYGTCVHVSSVERSGALGSGPWPSRSHASDNSFLTFSLKKKEKSLSISRLIVRSSDERSVIFLQCAIITCEWYYSSITVYERCTSVTSVSRKCVLPPCDVSSSLSTELFSAIPTQLHHQRRCLVKMENSSDSERLEKDSDVCSVASYASITPSCSSYAEALSASHADGDLVSNFSTLLSDGRNTSTHDGSTTEASYLRKLISSCTPEIANVSISVIDQMSSLNSFFSFPEKLWPAPKKLCLLGGLTIDSAPQCLKVSSFVECYDYRSLTQSVIRPSVPWTVRLWIQKRSISLVRLFCEKFRTRSPVPVVHFTLGWS